MLSLELMLQVMLRTEFGPDFENLVGVLPENTTVELYQTRELSDIEFIAFHHTEASSEATWRTVALYHTNARKWNKIAYHIGIRDHAGRCIVSLLNLPKTRTYHAHTVGNNHGLALVIAGKKDTEPVTPAELNTLKRTIEVIRRWATWRDWLPVVAHGSVPGNETTCPGRFLKEIIPMLNARVIDDSRLQAAVWEAATKAQSINPHAESAISKFMAEQGYYAIGQEVEVKLNGVWQGTTQLGYQSGGDQRGVAFFATNLTSDGQWSVHIMEAPEK